MDESGSSESPLTDLVFVTKEDTEEYLREEWPVEEGEQFSDLGEVEEAAKVLDDIVEAKNGTSLCVRRATGEPYVEFNFSGQYEKKKERKEQLRATLGNIGFSKRCSEEGFLRLGKTLNENEERALLEGFKGKYFFYMAKVCQLEKDAKSEGFLFDDWENKNDTQPELHANTKEAADEEVQNNKFTLFGGSFHVKSTEAVKAAILESIAFLQCEEESFTGLSLCNWSVAHNHARYRIAQHLLDCDRRKAFTNFCLRQFPKKRQRDEGEEKYEKKKARTTVSRSAPSESETILTEPHGAVEEKVHCAPPLGAPPVEQTIEIVEPEEPREETAESPPVFTAETHNQRRNAATGEELDDGEAHFLGFARFGAYAKDWEERHERKAISYKNFLLVFFVSLSLALAQLFLVPRMPQFQRWPKQFQWQPALQHLGAIVLALIIAYKATFVRAEPRRDLWLFCLTTALVFWVDTGCVISLCVSPTICCYAASKIMLWHKKKSMAWVPFAFLIAYTALTYESLLQQCLEIVKLFLVVTSFVYEQRHGSAVATVLFSPYRDLLFVVEFPAVYLYEFLEELDLV